MKNEAEWRERLLSIARNGLHYSTNPYDRERYEQLLALCLESYEALAGQPRDRFVAQLLQGEGQVTPPLGADAAIFDAGGNILLMDRVDGSGWCLPCGWVEAGEQPAAAACRETREETGLDVEVERLVGVFTRPAGKYGDLRSMCAVVHLCRVVGGELRLSHEGLALQYWAIDAVPQWHGNHKDYALAALRVWQDPSIAAISA